MTDLSMAPFDALITALASVGIKASMDASELNLPAAWVTVDQLERFNLAGDVTVRCLVYLVAPDADAYRAMASLVPMFRQLLEAVTPDGPCVTQGLVLPSDPTPMPAIRVPVNLHT